MKHGLANESVASTEYVSLLITQPVTVKLVKPVSKSHPFLEALLDPIIINADNLETLEVKIICLPSKLHQSINDVLKDKKIFFGKG